ncbi:hypothetical protein [Methylobrevis pamukkalensis]|uniref:hypothetical protein n=1 Tax=Methylobrevis pamukkalensis TaxID=1439726 RepID=UPI00084604D4|nr:hypothetical protein [Methylobrevis pamukkalensis]
MRDADTPASGAIPDRDTAPWRPSRRTVVLASLGAAFLPATAAASDTGAACPRLVHVLLRGGMDGLAAAAPLFEPRLRSLRPDPENAALGRVVDGFRLHPDLATFAALAGHGEALVVHAVGGSRPGLSHAEAIEALETGRADPGNGGDGWLGRLAALLRTNGAGGGALAAGHRPPPILRGASAPTHLPPFAGADAPFAATMNAIGTRLAADADLRIASAALRDGICTPGGPGRLCAPPGPSPISTTASPACAPRSGRSGATPSW